MSQLLHVAIDHRDRMLNISRDIAKELETAGDERFTATLWLAPKKTQAGWDESGLEAGGPHREKASWRSWSRSSRGTRGLTAKEFPHERVEAGTG